jgi:nucleoside-diphosphate-sugar epimerase
LRLQDALQTCASGVELAEPPTVDEPQNRQAFLQNSSCRHLHPVNHPAADMTRKILISGATGKQGGAVVKALLANPPPDVEILALTRNINSNSAKALAANPQVTLIEGDLDDCAAVFQKAGGISAVWGVFCVTVPNLKSKEQGLETKQGNAMVDAAVENKVKHIVFTSVDRGGPGKSDDEPTYVPHFMSKVSACS